MDGVREHSISRRKFVCVVHEGGNDMDFSCSGGPITIVFQLTINFPSVITFDFMVSIFLEGISASMPIVGWRISHPQ